MVLHYPGTTVFIFIPGNYYFSIAQDPKKKMSEPSHVQFRNSLKGQRVTIPSLYSLFPDWNNKLHKDYQRARDQVLNPWLKRYVYPIV